MECYRSNLRFECLGQAQVSGERERFECLGQAPRQPSRCYLGIIGVILKSGNNLKRTSASFSSTWNHTPRSSSPSPTPSNSILHTLSPRHTSCPPPTAIPAEGTPAPRRHPRIGNYPYYAVRVRRTTGIFTNWADCFQVTHGITNDFRGFESLSLT